MIKIFICFAAIKYNCRIGTKVSTDYNTSAVMAKCCGGYLGLDSYTKGISFAFGFWVIHFTCKILFSIKTHQNCFKVIQLLAIRLLQIIANVKRLHLSWKLLFKTRHEFQGNWDYNLKILSEMNPRSQQFCWVNGMMGNHHLGNESVTGLDSHC